MLAEDKWRLQCESHLYICIVQQKLCKRHTGNRWFTLCRNKTGRSSNMIFEQLVWLVIF